MQRTMLAQPKPQQQVRIPVVASDPPTRSGSPFVSPPHSVPRNSGIASAAIPSSHRVGSSSSSYHHSSLAGGSGSGSGGTGSLHVGINEQSHLLLHPNPAGGHIGLGVGELSSPRAGTGGGAGGGEHFESNYTDLAGEHAAEMEAVREFYPCEKFASRVMHTNSYTALYFFCALFGLSLLIWTLARQLCITNNQCIDYTRGEGLVYTVLLAVATAALAVELIIRLIGTRTQFCRSGFNIFDLIASAVAAASLALLLAGYYVSITAVLTPFVVFTRYFAQSIRLSLIKLRHADRVAALSVAAQFPVDFGAVHQTNAHLQHLLSPNGTGATAQRLLDPASPLPVSFPTRSGPVVPAARPGTGGSGGTPTTPTSDHLTVPIHSTSLTRSVTEPGNRQPDKMGRYDDQ